MRHDIKIKRLISKYGIEGYGLYNLILESIVEGISTDSPLPDLQETCEDLAEFYNGNTAKIDEIVRFMISQGLFEVEELTGKILCMKIYKFLEQSQTRSKAIRELIGKYKTATNVCDKSDRIEEYRKYVLKVRKRIEGDINKVEKVFQTYFEDRQFTDYFRKSVKMFLEVMDLYKVMDAMDMACLRKDESQEALKYFCGICWNIIKNRSSYNG